MRPFVDQGLLALNQDPKPKFSVYTVEPYSRISLRFAITKRASGLSLHVVPYLM